MTKQDKLQMVIDMAMAFADEFEDEISDKQKKEAINALYALGVKGIKPAAKKPAAKKDPAKKDFMDMWLEYYRDNKSKK